MSIDLDVVTRLNKASAREAAREAQNQFKGTGEDIGEDLGDGIARGLNAKGPEIEKALRKVADASGKVLVEQQKLEDLKKQSNATDTQKITQSERLAKAMRAEEQAIRDVNRMLDDHNTKSDDAIVKTRNLGDEAGKAAKKIGDLGGAFKGLGAVGLLGTLPAVATGIVEVAGALQQLSGAALAGPGIFAGIAASAGTAALGMQGMSDAFTASIKALDGTKASVEAANKALADLSPNAADAVKTVVGLKGTFTELRDIASTNLFQGFSGNLKSLVAADLPMLTKGIDGISKGLNQNLTEVMRSLGSSSSQGFLDRILGNTAEAQGRLTAAIDPIIHAVGVLTAAGSDTLPRLADAVGAVADRFDRFISTADANGNLAKWINEGLDGFTSLGNTLLNLGTTFTALTQAAGGGAGLLGTLESATDKLSTFLNSTQGQSQLRDYFTQGRDMLVQLKDIAVQAGPLLAGMFQAASSAARTWLPIIEQILQTINAIPGGAAAVVDAFVAWQGIKGIAAVATGLSAIVNVLKFAIPGAATEGAAGISAAFAGITLPGWLSSFLAAGGSIAALPAVAMTFAKQGSDYYEAHDPGATNENASGRGREGLARRTANDGQVDPNQVTAPGYGGGGGSFGPGPSPGYGASAAPGWTPILQNGPAARPGTFRRRDGSIGTLPSAGGPPVNTPDVSGYTPPTVTEGDKGGDAASKVPYIDPTKFAVGDPLAGMPAAAPNADPQAVYEADSRALTAANNLSQGKLALAVLEAKGTATQQELLTAKNNIQEQERALYDAQFKDLEARQGKMAKASGDLQSIFAPLDQDFGVSGGIPGIVKNLVTFLGNLALGGAIASSPQLQAAALQMQQTNTQGGTPGAMFAPGGQMPPGGLGNGSVGGYPGDAALMANVPSNGKYQWGGSDLAKGLADCSGAVGNLANTLEGNAQNAGGKLNTGNAAQWLPAHGFLPNNSGANVPGAFNVGYNDHHMQATLPGGTNFNWGSDAAAAKRGIDGAGAADPAFTDHYYLPVGASPSAMGPAPIGGGVGSANTGLGGGSLPVPLPVTIVGGLGSPFAPGAPTAGVQSPAGSAPTPGVSPGAPGLFSPENTSPGLMNPVAPAPVAPGGAGPLPPIPAGAGGGQGYMGVGGPGAAPGAAPGTSSMSQAASGGGGGGGVGMTPGGTLDSALSAAAAGADLFAPGAGQAAQVGIKLANRAIQYGAQAASIGVSGLMETFLPHNSELGDPGKSWVGKIAGGIAGAKPAGPNQAGKPADPQKQDGNQTDKGQQQNGPMVNIENMHNNGGDGQQVGNDIARQQYASYSAGGPR